jgi:hypothetical protein
MLKKASIIVNYSKNPDFINKWFKLNIEDWKVVLYWKGGDKIKEFTIPTMNEDWTINNKENLSRLENPLVWFEDFIQKYTGVKSYAEIWADNIAKKNNQERITSTNEEVKTFNKWLIKNIQRNIDSLTTPEWVEIIINHEKNRVQINYNGKRISYYTPNLKDSTWNTIKYGEDNKWMNYPIDFTKWVKDKTDKFA